MSPRGTWYPHKHHLAARSLTTEPRAQRQPSTSPTRSLSPHYQHRTQTRAHTNTRDAHHVAMLKALHGSPRRKRNQPLLIIPIRCSIYAYIALLQLRPLLLLICVLLLLADAVRNRTPAIRGCFHTNRIVFTVNRIIPDSHTLVQALSVSLLVRSRHLPKRTSVPLMATTGIRGPAGGRRPAPTKRPCIYCNNTNTRHAYTTAYTLSSVVLHSTLGIDH